MKASQAFTERSAMPNGALGVSRSQERYIEKGQMGCRSNSKTLSEIRLLHGRLRSTCKRANGTCWTSTGSRWAWDGFEESIEISVCYG
jgi:hypothetical protein